MVVRGWRNRTNKPDIAGGAGMGRGGGGIRAGGRRRKEKAYGRRKVEDTEIRASVRSRDGYTAKGGGAGVHV
jgi:hypothetical protein